MCGASVSVQPFLARAPDDTWIDGLNRGWERMVRLPQSCTIDTKENRGQFTFLVCVRTSFRCFHPILLVLLYFCVSLCAVLNAAVALLECMQGARDPRADCVESVNRLPGSLPHVTRWMMSDPEYISSQENSSPYFGRKHLEPTTAVRRCDWLERLVCIRFEGRRGDIAQSQGDYLVIQSDVDHGVV